VTKAVLPVMRKQGSGHIIQMSSIVGLQGAISVSSYSASKHALGRVERVAAVGGECAGNQGRIGAFDTGVWKRGAVMGKEAIKPSSPNFQRSLRMRSAIEKIPKADPIAVARVIAEIAQDPSPKLRYLVGRDAKIQLAM